MADDIELARGRVPRRVSTAPVDSSSPPPGPGLSTTSASRTEELVETLYSHPSVKIIAFTSNQRSSFEPRPSSSDADQPGTLPASSRLERTIAVGPFRIYRAPGSVAFLSCGSALQPILPKSQCWALDEDNSRFVLQIRRPQYWRIELPVSESEDKERALVLRDVLDKVSLFEKTQCPFQRNFTVELPDQPLSPKKKAWTPEGKNLITDAFSSLASPNDRRASIWADQVASYKFDVDPISETDEPRYRFWHEGMEHIKPEHKEPMAGDVKPYIDYYQSNSNRSLSAETTPTKPRGRPGKGLAAASPDTTTKSSPTQSDRSGMSGSKEKGVTDDEIVDEPSSFEGSGRVVPMNLTRKRMSRRLAGRTFTAPPQLSVKAPSPPTSKETPDVAKAPVPQPPQPSSSEDNSSLGSTDSFQSVQTWHSPNTSLPPSPPASRPVTPCQSQSSHHYDDLVTPRQPSHETNDAALANTPDTDKTFAESAAEETTSPVVPFPSASNDNHEKASHTSALEERPSIRLRPRPNSLSISRRALSPLPSAANLFTPPKRQPSQSRVATLRRIPSQIIQKTMELLLKPPAYLVSLMLKVAARIAAGEWRGLVFGFGEGGEKIPVEWDYSDEEFSDWSDDEDYALARSRQSSSNSIPQTAGRGKRASADDEDNRGSEVD
ncbi:hypothetical protein M426DRAFT_27624 [Hypoxylon sp. CI-4A]|nr:hypothetical protein M426DRAFT_27624 [Hypoxylon sp. CI-4A]